MLEGKGGMIRHIKGCDNDDGSDSDNDDGSDNNNNDDHGLPQAGPCCRVWKKSR